MNRQTLLWTVVVFFGASIVFSSLNRLTEGESAGVRAAVQIGALVVLIAAVLLFMRLRNRP